MVRGGAGQGEAINIFLDGDPLSSNAITGSDSIWDVKQVEVLRGSQSILQGRNAIGGAVVLSTNDPSYNWEGATRVRYGENGERQYSGVVSGPIIQDQLAFRLSGDFNETDGIVTSAINGENVDRQDNLTVRGKLLIEPNALESIRTELTVEYTESDFGRTTPFVVSDSGLANEDSLAASRVERLANFDPNEDLTFSNFSPDFEVETLKLISDISYDFTDYISLDFIGTYEKAETDSTSFLIEPNQFGGVGSATISDTDTYSADVRLTFDYEKIKGIAGLYYFDTEIVSDIDSIRIIADAVPFPITPADSIVTFPGTVTRSTDNISLYTSWRYTPNETWVFDLGLRFDNESFETLTTIGDSFVTPGDCTGTVPGAFLGVPIPVVTIDCGVGAEQFLAQPETPLESDNFNVFLPSGAVTYNITNDKSVFFGARRGYRAGGTFLTGGANAQSIANPFTVVAFDPEFLDTVEAGWRSLWFDGQLTFNGTAYYSEYKDQQVRFTNEAGQDITVNAGATSLYGLEISFDYKATDAWNIYGSLALKDTQFDEFVFRADDPTTAEDETIDLAGNELDRAENLSFTLGASYTNDNGLFGSVSVSYKSSYFSDIFNLDESTLPGGLTEKIDGAAVANGRIGYDFDSGRISLVGQNLFDEDTPERVNYASSGFINGTSGLGDSGSATLRQPRTFSVILDLYF